MNEVLKKIMQTGVVKSTDGSIVPLTSHIDLDQGRFLQKMISKANGEISLEVGLAYGISALFICDSFIKTKDHRHIVIDPFQLTQWKGIGLNNLKMAGFERSIDFYNLPSHLALPQIETQKMILDFAFIDGMHTFDYSLIDFFYIDRMLRIGGIVVLDDVGMAGIKKLCKYILTNRAYSLVDYSGSIKDSIPLSIFSKIIKFFLSPFLNSRRVEFLVKAGIFRGIRCIAFRKESEDTRHWAYHRYF